MQKNTPSSSDSGQQDMDSTRSSNSENKTSKTSDCGYGTQVEIQEFISTSSNEDELPSKKPVHQKPHHPKRRVNNNKTRATVTIQDRRRKKIVKRGKANM